MKIILLVTLNEDLLDDRVTTLVITSQSTALGKASTSGGSTSTSDSSLTVTAAAAANILSKKFMLTPTPLELDTVIIISLQLHT